MKASSAPLGIRKVERPRPLRSVSHIGLPSNVAATNPSLAASASNRRMSAQDTSSVEEVVQLLEQITTNLESKNYDKPVVQAIIHLNGLLKSHGAQVELFHRDFLDKSQGILRNACKDTTLDIVARLHLLEIIELRSMKWVLTESVTNYYKQKLSMVDFDHDELFSTAMTKKQPLNVNAPLFTPQLNLTGGGNILDQLLPNQTASSAIPTGEVMINSGKYTGPTQPHGKSYYKDEVCIRNADSGKVMGVKGRRVHMIEEMSGTIISFQRVLPGSVDRLVQITGSIPTSVAQAKVLMEDTIRRNQSPLPDFIGSKAEEVQAPAAVATEYKFSVKVGDELLKISSTNLSLVKSAKILLDEHYSNNNNHAVKNMTVSRQPLFPNSTADAIELADLMGGHSKQRRENFAKTHMDKAANNVNSSNCKPKSLLYTRGFILNCAHSPFSHEYPPNWEALAADFPELVRKESQRFDGKSYAQIPINKLLPMLTLAKASSTVTPNLATEADIDEELEQQ